MLRARWEPWTEMNRLSREMDRLFGRMANNKARPAGAATFPALNAWEDQEQYYVEAELPGFRMEDLEITVLGNQLTVKGERKPPQVEGGTWHRQERGHGSFSRTLELPGDIDSERVEATLKLGVLCVSLPKAAAAKPRRIEVKGN